MLKRVMARAPTARFLVGAAAVLLWIGSADAAEVPITLEQAVRLAVQRNLDLQAQAFAPALSETDVRRAGALYAPKVGASLDHKGDVSPVVPIRDTSINRNVYDANVSVDRLLPSGATLSGGVSSVWTRTDPSNPLTDTDQPSLSVRLSQPLLQGRGQEVTEQGLTSARNAREAAYIGWRAAALDTAASARDQYFTLLKARQSLETRQISLTLAQRVHEENQAKVREGVLPAVDLLDSELGVEARRFDLLDAQRAVTDQSDRLRVLIRLSGTADLATDAQFPPLERPASESEEISKAVSRRPELIQARIALRTLELQERVSQNSTLPSVSLTGSAGLTAMRNDYGKAWTDVADWRYPFWSVGLALSYPLGNDAAEANLTASRLRRSQAKVQLRSQEETVALSVRSALRTVDTRQRQIAVAERGVAVAETRLDSFVKRKALGLATTKDVLQAEADLTTAKVALSGARADYQSALTQLWRSTGELLERHGVTIEDAEVLEMTRKENP